MDPNMTNYSLTSSGETPASLLRMCSAHAASQSADAYLKSNNFRAAKEKYYAAALAIVGAPGEIPWRRSDGDGGGVQSAKYTSLGHYERTELMRACNGMAKCLLKENKREEALAWLEEVNVLYRNLYFAADTPKWDWEDYAIDLPDMTLHRVTALALQSDIFVSVGNTGGGAHRRWNGSTSTVSLPAQHRTPALKAVCNATLTSKLVMMRHPDPHTANKIELVDPALQVRGSWEKLNVKMGGMFNRMTMSTFIWNSHFYVAGGRKDSLGPYFRDLWRLDLNKPDVWRKLPAYPIPTNETGVFLGWNMIPYQDKAYLFTGRSQLDFFDLNLQKWGFITTTYTPAPSDVRAGITGKWPYPGSILTDSTAQIANGKMYVFGGTHKKTNVGCNLFMQLDLETRVWTRLSGTVNLQAPDYSCPGPRKTPSSWVANDRMYVIFGEADRSGAAFLKEPFGANRGFPFEDFWSWDLVGGKKWRRERTGGNAPCPRSEMAATFNPKLNKAIIWGGYNPSVPTFTKEAHFDFSYFADTFMYDASSPTANPTWKQVITRGFPTYRCQAHLQSDPITGKTYLFGGFTNTQFVPTCTKQISRSFGDVWQLKIDEPGGCFEGVDLEEEMRTAKAGPWQRCFTCVSAGPWKKCGGSCKGAAFFCSSECLKEGWKEHKQRHKCSKA